ncbi:MAG: IS30 family transposase [Patescibacteria group bacterium]
MGYTHIDENERRRIERAIEAGKGVREIARMTGRSPGTISDELRRNRVRKRYTRQQAQQKAYLRRKRSKLQCLKVAMDPVLKKYVTENIEKDQSPEAIAGRLKNVETDIQHASTKAIYKFVHSSHGRKIENHLYSKAVKKRGGPKRGARKVSIDGRIMIDKRPKKVEKRKEFGHFEGDFIESGKDGTGSLLVLVERKTRYPFLVYTENKSTAHINDLVATTLQYVPIKSITLDNDLSFQKHLELSALLDAIVFFCHPYQSSEKGTVENRNRAVRRYVPKKTNLSSVSIERFKEIETILRTRYMKVLNFKTPEEVWNIEMEKEKQRRKRKWKRATMTPLLTSINQKVGVRLQRFL